MKQCTDFDTNSNNVYDGSDHGCDTINSELDLEWVSSMTDHFLISWNMNNEIKEKITLKDTWRLNSDKWDAYRTSLMTGMNLLMNFIVKHIANIKNDKEMKDFIDIITEKMAKQIRVQGCSAYKVSRL